jgi:HD superfamily phosphodiesterase
MMTAWKYIYVIFIAEVLVGVRAEVLEGVLEGVKCSMKTKKNHFFDKLLKLKDLMMTAPGKKEAELRHTYLVDFLKQFFKEEQADAWLRFLNTFLKEKH